MPSKQQYEDLINQLYARYMESFYPTSFSRSFLRLSPNQAQPSLSSFTPGTKIKTAPIELCKSPHLEQSTQPAPTPASHPSPAKITSMFPRSAPRRQQQTSWYYVRPLLIHNHEELRKKSFKSLEPYVIKEDKIIQPCCTLFVFNHEEEEFSFFHRLAKIISQRLFPARMDVLADPITTIPQSSSRLCLAPLKMLQMLHPSASLHHPLKNSTTTWIPMASSLQYEQDPQTKQDLWTLLKQQPFVYTQK